MCPLGLGEDIGSLREEVIGGNKVSDWELNSSPLHSYSLGHLSGPQLILQMPFPYGEMHDNPFLTRSKEGRTMSRMQESSFCRRRVRSLTYTRMGLRSRPFDCKPCSLTAHSAPLQRFISNPCVCPHVWERRSEQAYL